MQLAAAEQPAVQDWRDRGGLLISDAPGSAMVREYYAATASSGTISVTQAALEAQSRRHTG